MKELFYKQYDFNENFNHWDVSNVTNMSRIFYKAKSFNQPLSAWQTHNVEDMSLAEAFNQPL